MSKHPCTTHWPEYKPVAEELKRASVVLLKTDDTEDVVLVGFRNKNDFDRNQEKVCSVAKEVLYKGKALEVTKEITDKVVQIRSLGVTDPYLHDEDKVRDKVWYRFYAYRFEYYVVDSFQSYTSALQILPKISRTEIEDYKDVYVVIMTKNKEAVTKDYTVF